MKLTDAQLIEICNRMFPLADTVGATARRQLRKLYEGLARIGAIEGSGVQAVKLVELDDFEQHPEPFDGFFADGE